MTINSAYLPEPEPKRKTKKNGKPSTTGSPARKASKPATPPAHPRARPSCGKTPPNNQRQGARPYFRLAQRNLHGAIEPISTTLQMYIPPWLQFSYMNTRSRRIPAVSRWTTVHPHQSCVIGN